MRKPGNKLSSVFEKALVAIVWILVGAWLACWGMKGVLSGRPTRAETGIWWDYFALIAGSGMVVTGICYYFLPRVNTWIGKQSNWTWKRGSTVGSRGTRSGGSSESKVAHNKPPR